MNKTIPTPVEGDVIPQERILYFFGGKVVNGRIKVTQKDRDWHYVPSVGEELAYVITKETAKQYQTTAVRINADNVVQSVGRSAPFSKSETKECICTPGMIQVIGEPVMGMFTHDKADIVVVHRAMRQALFDEINQQQQIIDQMESVMINS